MIFSNERIAQVLETEFECVWESVGPVPQVRIDFGNGEVLETTLGGNVLTSFCLPDGMVFDVLPGVINAEAYVLAAHEAGQFARRIQSLPEAERTLAARRYPLREPAALAWRRHVDTGRNASTSDIAKGPFFLNALDPFPLVEKPSDLRTFDVAISKSISGERSLVEKIRAKPFSSVAETLAADTILVERMLRPQARGVLGTLAGRSPAEVTPHIFRLVLQIDLDDPHLGLGSALFRAR